MGELAVFVPGNCARHASTIKALGLGGLLDERVNVSTTDMPGPGGMGTRFNFSHDHEPEYKSEPVATDAHWVPLAKSGELAAGRAFIGWNHDAPPTPNELRRKHVHEGAYVKLADGNEWKIPVARQLPCVMGINIDGEYVTQPEARYRSFWDASKRAINWFEETPDGKLRLEVAESFQFALDAISINYRMSQDLLTALGMVTTDNVYEIAIAVCEWKEICDALAQKKTSHDMQPTCVGASA